MDEKKREEMEQTGTEVNEDVIVVVDDNQDFEELVKEEKKKKRDQQRDQKEMKKDTVSMDKGSDVQKDSEPDSYSEDKKIAANHGDFGNVKSGNYSEIKKAVDGSKDAADRKSVDGSKDAAGRTSVDGGKDATGRTSVDGGKDAAGRTSVNDSRNLTDGKSIDNMKNSVDKTSAGGKSNSQASNRAISQSKRISEAKRASEIAATLEPAGKKKSGSVGKGILIGFGIIAGLLLIVYVSGFVYFSNHFYQDVAVNGIDVSGMNKEAAKNVLDAFYQNYNLTLETIDSEEITIDGKDIGARVSLHDTFSDLFKLQEPALWFVNMFEHHDYQMNAEASWDDDALEKELASIDAFQTENMIKPEDAYVDATEDKFEIVDEVTGTTLNEKTFNEALHNSLASVQSKLNLVEAECYELPQIYSDDEGLVQELEDKNAYAQNVIKLQMDDLTLEPGMELYEEVLEKSGNGYQISKTKVTKYVNDLANQYDTMGKDRTFKTSFSGKTVVTTGTAFGYELNVDETVDALYNALTAKKSTTVDAIFVSKGKTLKGDNDIGDTYVEVNLSEQRVIGYKNGKKVCEGDCVSGKESTGNGTHTGLYAIQDKLSPTVLRGEKKAVTKTVKKKNKKGKKVEKTVTSYEYEYESPVTYWLQFNGGEGLHDAAGWRSAYGGSIYYYSGSHGCVNLPLDLAKTIYENFEVGDPVIVYFWDNVNRK